MLVVAPCSNNPYPRYRWQCFQDAVYFKLLGVARASHDDLRRKYVDKKRTFDHSAPPPSATGSYFFDFVADTGDSFNGSYTVSSLMAGSVCGLPAPSVVLHGGDLSYPWPQKHEMWNRFVLPLEYAKPKPIVRGHGEDVSMYIVPGNHEWDDGLTTFDSLIVGELSTIGQYKIPQQASYFAIKLPRGWWVFGVDSTDNDGAEKDIDDAQFDYFMDVYKKQVGPDDSIIMINHVPEYFWNYCLGFEKGKRFCELRENLGDSFAAQFSGDMHFYKRYVSAAKDDGKQYIICGGGGGFGHSTANPVSDTAVCNYPFTDGPEHDELSLCTDFPTQKEANRYFNRQIFAFRHWGLSKMIAFFYLMMAASTDTNREAGREGVVIGVKELLNDTVNFQGRGNFYPFLGFIVMFLM